MPRLVYNSKELVLTDSEVVLGRHRDNAMQIDDSKASRRHCRVFTKPDGTVERHVETDGDADFPPPQLEQSQEPQKIEDGRRRRKRQQR